MFEDCSYLVADFTYLYNLRGSVPGLTTDSSSLYHKCNTIYVCTHTHTHTHTHAHTYARTHTHTLFFNSWLCWVLVALLGLSPAAVMGAPSHCHVCASCSGFSRCRAQALCVWASVVASHRRWSIGSVLGASEVVASWHARFSQTRDQTYDAYIGRQILIHWVRKVP